VEGGLLFPEQDPLDLPFYALTFDFWRFEDTGGFRKTLDEIRDHSVRSDSPTKHALSKLQGITP
jgi:hypothetical protein